MFRHIVAALAVACAIAGPAQAANVHSRAGAHATVAAKYVAQFQAIIDDFEAAGARIIFMGGVRSGYCWQGGKHPCGMALDVCQLRRGIVDRRCHLPGPREASRIAKRHSLFSGGDWCNSDYGHFEAGGSAACGERWRGTYALSNHHQHRVVARGHGRMRAAGAGGPAWGGSSWGHI